MEYQESKGVRGQDEDWLLAEYERIRDLELDTIKTMVLRSFALYEIFRRAGTTYDKLKKELIPQEIFQ